LKYDSRVLQLEVPDDNVAWVVSPQDQPALVNEEEEIRNVIRNPIGMEGLKELVKKKGKNTIILVDDTTRFTPHKKVLPILIDMLNIAGVKDSDITVLIALGTHRFMTRAECVNVYGKEVINRVKVINHLWNDDEELVRVGKTPSGIPIMANKHYYNSDISIAVGSIIPHVYAGWSGGAKMVQPGVSGAETTAKTHLLATKYLDCILGNSDNVVRKEMEIIARQTGLSMIVNSIMNSDFSLAGIVAGDLVKAHREGVKIAKKIYALPIVENPDIVVVNAYPGNLDLWQSTKALMAGTIFS